MSANQTMLNVGVDSVVNKTASRYVLALIIIALGFLIGKLLSAFLKYILDKVKLNEKVKLIVGNDVLVEETLSFALYFLSVLFSIILALNTLSFFSRFIVWLVILVIVIVIISILISLKDLTVDFLSGVVVRSRGILKKGVYVKIGSVEGLVLKFDLFSVILKSDDELIRIPNHKVLKSDVVRIKKTKI